MVKSNVGRVNGDGLEFVSIGSLVLVFSIEVAAAIDLTVVPIGSISGLVSSFVLRFLCDWVWFEVDMFS